MKVKDCCILYRPLRCGVKRTLYRLQGENRSCIFTYNGTEDVLFHYCDDSYVSLWLLYQYADHLSIHLSVDHMVVNEVVGHSHGSAGMAYAMAFTLF